MRQKVTEPLKKVRKWKTRVEVQVLHCSMSTTTVMLTRHSLITALQQEQPRDSGNAQGVCAHRTDIDWNSTSSS